MLFNTILFLIEQHGQGADVKLFHCEAGREFEPRRLRRFFWPFFVFEFSRICWFIICLFCSWWVKIICNVANCNWCCLLNLHFWNKARRELLLKKTFSFLSFLKIQSKTLTSEATSTTGRSPKTSPTKFSPAVKPVRPDSPTRMTSSFPARIVRPRFSTLWGAATGSRSPLTSATTKVNNFETLHQSFSGQALLRTTSSY